MGVSNSSTGRTTVATQAIYTLQHRRLPRYSNSTKSKSLERGSGLQMRIHVDVETRSLAKLKDVGTWSYSLHPSTDIWCMCWMLEGEEVESWLPGYAVPSVFNFPFVLAAHNYKFEQAIWRNIMMERYGFPEPVGYECTMAMGMVNNLPASLEDLGDRLGIDNPKDTKTKSLMVRMSNAKTYDPEKEGSTAQKNHDENLDKLIAYCCQDVRAEAEIYHRLKNRSYKYQEFAADDQINSRGIQVDVETATAIRKAIDNEKKLVNQQLKEVTGGAVGTGREVAKLTAWLQGQGYPYDNVLRENVREVLTRPDHGMTEAACEALLLRQKLALGSIAKFKVIEQAHDSGRMHGLFQLYGASQTGRWAGRLVQMQNLPRMNLSEQEADALAVLFREQRIGEIKMIFGDDLFAVAKQMIRPMFVAPEGKHLVVSDLAQIECRVLAWLSGCQRLINQFTDENRDPYSDMAAEIYHRPASEFGKGTRERQLGKTVILGCGYQMGAEKFKATVASHIGLDLDDEQAKLIINAYRRVHPEICAFWSSCEEKVQKIAEHRGDNGAVSEGLGQIMLHSVPGTDDVRITLPSGRKLNYPKLQVVTDLELNRNVQNFTTAFGNTSNMYGGRYAENITQAVARDVLMEAILRLEQSGLRVVGHVHDEVIVEVDNPVDKDKVHQIMSSKPAWADGLPLDAETAICKRYVK